jgi:small-conductance mechanosensitive channel
VAVAALLITPETGTATSSPLTRACGSAAGIACRLVWEVSHNAHAADFTSVYVAGPVRLVLRIAFVILLAALLRFAAGRLIVRLTTRAAAGRARSDDAADQVALPPGAADDGSQDSGAGSGDQAADGYTRQVVLTGRRSQRATAMASVLSNAASVTIFTVAGVIILGDLGLNLAPVLASAGVLGIAIGFGAQNLVQDFLAGIFMLLEDQYGVGDVVDIGSVTGTVEAVSLRITRLRDVNGVVWHIRNGTIKRAGNETHGWARAVIDFPVPYQVSVAAARGSLERAAVSMWEEPAWHAVILDRPEVWGVEDVQTDTVLIRVAARTVPQGKVEVLRELRERLKDALDAQAAPLAPAVAGASGAGPERAAGQASLTSLSDAVPQQPEPPAE